MLRQGAATDVFRSLDHLKQAPGTFLPRYVSTPQGRSMRWSRGGTKESRKAEVEGGKHVEEFPSHQSLAPPCSVTRSSESPSRL